MTTLASLNGNVFLEVSADYGGTLYFQNYDSSGLLTIHADGVDLLTQPQGRCLFSLPNPLPSNRDQFVTYQPYDLALPAKTIHIIRAHDESHLGDSGTLHSIRVEFHRSVFPFHGANGKVQMITLEPSYRVFQRSVVHARESSVGQSIRGEFRSVFIDSFAVGNTKQLYTAVLNTEMFSLGRFHPASIEESQNRFG